MFTGIIEEIGQINRIIRQGKTSLIEVKANIVNQDIKIGDSIAVNGVCLTAVKNQSGVLSFDAMPETLKLTNLGILKIGDKVNLERALKMGDRISGHFVTGHVDCLGLIRGKSFFQDNLCFEIAVPAKFIKNIIPKGSIAIDGISLTIAEKRADSLRVYIIPHTLKNTILEFKNPSAKVNIEFDVLVKSKI